MEVSKLIIESGTYDIKDSKGRQLIDKLVKKFFIVEPSGDISGKTDLENINNALKNHFSVYL